MNGFFSKKTEASFTTNLKRSISHYMFYVFYLSKSKESYSSFFVIFLQSFLTCEGRICKLFLTHNFLLYSNKVIFF